MERLYRGDFENERLSSFLRASFLPPPYPPPLPHPFSGVRAVVVDAAGQAQFDSSIRWAAPDDPDEWLRAADTLMGDVPLALRE